MANLGSMLEKCSTSWRETPNESSESTWIFGFKVVLKIHGFMVFQISRAISCVSLSNGISGDKNIDYMDFFSIQSRSLIADFDCVY